MKKWTIEEITEDLEKSGFPLEIEITNILGNRKWRVINQLHCFNLKDNFDSVLDVLAFREYHHKIAKLNPINLNLLIECKKTDKSPWVFGTIEEHHPPDLANIFAISYVKYYMKTPPTININKSLLKWIPQSHFLDKNIKNVGCIAYEVGTKGEGKVFYKAVTQVTNALICYHNENVDLFKKLYKTSIGRNKYPLIIYYPVIVFDGQMFEFKIIGGEIKVTPVSYIQYKTERVINNKKEYFRIDIVQKNYFQDYLGIIEKEWNNIVNLFKSTVL